MNIRDIATAIWAIVSADHITSIDMIRDENGSLNLAKFTTSTGHFLVAGTEEDEEGAYITYSVYAPGDEDMADGPITTDGFKTATEEHAAAYLTDILAGY